MGSFESAVKLSAAALAINAALVAVKIAAGVFGNSYVLIADGIESAADVFSSFVVWAGLRVSAFRRMRDPYGLARRN